MRIYTRSGDDGTTGLYGGTRVSKAALRVETYGTIDELNAVLGWARAAGLPAEVDEALSAAQETCFRLGAFIATAPGKDPGIAPITDAEVGAFEAAIDAADAVLPTLKSFVLPGGSEGAARLHIARTVCRRAERLLVALGQASDTDSGWNPVWVQWLNRLSDLLFVEARLVNQAAGQPDVPWEAQP